MLQAGITHLRPAQQQFPELLQTFQMSQAGVGDPGALELQGAKFGQVRKVAHLGVADLTAEQEQPHNRFALRFGVALHSCARAEGFEGFRFEVWLGGPVGLFFFRRAFALGEGGEQAERRPMIRATGPRTER